MALMIKNLQFTKINSSSVLSIEDFTLQNCEWLCIIGGNGSGKSTIASIISGWVPSLLPGEVQGSIQLNDEEILGQSTLALSPKIQYVQQAPQWQLSDCAFTVEEELTFGVENLGINESTILEQLENILYLMDLMHLRKRNPTTLSGGEMQRLVIGSSLMMQPQLLILDEAFSRMTHENQTKILQKLQIIAEQSSMNIILLEKNGIPFLEFCQHSIQLQKRDFS